MIDTHVHIWTMDAKKYPWQQTLRTVPIPKEPGTIEQFIACMDENNITNAVLVQPSVYGWDNSYLCDSLDRYPKRFAGVCLVDPQSKNAAADLIRWCDGRGCQGLRINTVAYTQIDFLLAPEMTKLWDAAAQLGASVSFQMDPGQSQIIHMLAQRRPEITFIIDQVAKRVHEETTLNGFLDTLSQQPNIFIKLNSVGQNSNEKYPFRDLWPFFHRAVDTFGVDRITYGTDFPHVLRSCSYAQAIAWLDELPFVHADDRASIAEGTARKLWKFG